jgi:hypothetical protein
MVALPTRKTCCALLVHAISTIRACGGAVARHHKSGPLTPIAGAPEDFGSVKAAEPTSNANYANYANYALLRHTT